VSPDLKTRVRHYAEHLDELAAPVTFEELIDREVEPITMPEVERRVLTTRRRAWVAAAAAVLVLVLIGGAALLLGNLGTEPDLIDEPTTTAPIEPTTTTEAIPPSGGLAGISINNLGADIEVFAPAIGIDEAGSPVVVYRHGPGSLEVETGQIEIFHCGDPACSTVASSNTIEYTGAEVSVYTAFGPDGSPMIVFAAFDQIPKLHRCADPSCSDYSITPLEGDMWIGDLTVDPAGNPAMFGYVGDEPQLITCLNAACTERTATSLVLPDGWGRTAVTYGRDGHPLLYSIGHDVERRVSPIHVIHCGDATCSSDNTTTHVLDAGETESNLAVAVGADGNPVIAFGNRQLQVVTCNDPSCTSTGPVMNVGPRMIIEGEGLSLHQRSGGNPVIAFTAARNANEPQQPMLAVCADAACETGTVGLVDTQPSVWLVAAGTTDIGGIRLAYGNWQELWAASCDGAGCRNGLLDPVTWDQSPVPEISIPTLGPIMEGWVRVPHDPAVFGPGGGGALYSVFETSLGLIALGDSCELVDGNSQCDAGIWLSADGTSWELTVTGTELGGQATSIAEGPNGLVAVGGTCPDTPDGGMGPCEAAVWTSADARSWSSVPVSRDVFGCPDEPECDFQLAGITEGGPGLVAWGSGFGGHWIWTSIDGTDWQQADMDGAGTMIDDIVALGDRLIAVGDTYTDIYNEAGEWVNFTEDLAVFTSADGFSWSQVPDPLFQTGSALRIATWARGITVNGTTCDENWNCTRQIWNSPSGLDWTRTPLDLGVDDAGLFSMVAGGPGLIAHGSVHDAIEETQTAVFWTSADGVTWDLYEADPVVFAEGGGINDFAWFDDRLIGVGSSPVDRTPAVWIWTP
jgi:hypothetical protein